MTVTVSGYLILIKQDFSLVFVSIEKIYQTLMTVFDHSSKHPEARQNIPLRVVFSTHFSVFRNVVKLGLSCLTYY